jgi:hypothetical protein
MIVPMIVLKVQHGVLTNWQSSLHSFKQCCVCALTNTWNSDSLTLAHLALSQSQLTQLPMDMIPLFSHLLKVTRHTLQSNIPLISFLLVRIFLKNFELLMVMSAKMISILLVLLDVTALLFQMCQALGVYWSLSLVT